METAKIILRFIGFLILISIQGYVHLYLIKTDLQTIVFCILLLPIYYLYIMYVIVKPLTKDKNHVS